MKETLTRGVFLRPGEGAAVKNPVGGPLTFKIRGEQTDGALTAFESTVSPGEGPPLHLHENEDEIWYALAGTFRVRLGEEMRAAPAGTFVFIPKKVVHTWQNVGDQPARLLAILMPAGLEQFFERFAALPADASPAEEFRRLGAEVGMTVVGPTLSESDPSSTSVTFPHAGARESG
jgi:quercetin dioxygenase-like cupin family protein